MTMAPGGTWCYIYRSDNGDGMTRPRIIQTEGAPNLRDLGGYPAANGKTVKWGLVFRSDDLNDLTDADVRALMNLGIATVVDFRDRVEAVNYPDRLPDSVRTHRNIPIEAGKLMGGAGWHVTRNKMTGIMISAYRAMVNDYQASFRELFDLLADPDNLPLLFHCSAGKDRTGIASALFLSALGVRRETIVQDFLMSRECLKHKYVYGVDYDDDMEPMYTVHPEYLRAAFEVIDGRFGGVDRYLTERLGVDLEKFRERYTE